MGRHPTFDMDILDKFTELVNNNLTPIIYLAIDPGKFNGVCGYDEKYQLHFMHVVASTDMTKFIRAFNNVTTCIIEDFKLYPNKAFEQAYSDMETPRVIGRVEDWATMRDIRVIKQGASIKKTGYLWLGKTPPSKSSNQNDPMDAHVHFIYWAVMHNKINAIDLLKKTAGNSLYK